MGSSVLGNGVWGPSATCRAASFIKYHHYAHAFVLCLEPDEDGDLGLMDKDRREPCQRGPRPLPEHFRNKPLDLDHMLAASSG